MDENFAGFNKGRRPKFLVGARHKMVYLRKRTFLHLDDITTVKKIELLSLHKFEQKDGIEENPMMK